MNSERIKQIIKNEVKYQIIDKCFKPYKKEIYTLLNVSNLIKYNTCKKK